MLTGKQRVISALALLGAATIITDASANGPFVWKLTVTNLTAPQFDDFHATFAGTGGSIKNDVLKIDPHGTGVLTEMGNMVWVDWPTGDWIAPGMTFQVNFDTDFTLIDLVAVN